MVYYINIKSAYGVETIDEFETRKEAFQKENKKMNKQQLEKIKEFVGLNQGDLDIIYHLNELDLLELNDSYDIIEYFRDLNNDLIITNEEVIYYYKAMEYLQENDPSLNESLNLAADCGYDIENINSELLATLLKSVNNLNDYEDFLEELEKFLEEEF